MQRSRDIDIIEEVGSGLRAVKSAMLAAFKAHGQGTVGRRVAIAWNEGLMMSLGVDLEIVLEPKNASERRWLQTSWCGE